MAFSKALKKRVATTSGSAIVIVIVTMVLLSLFIPYVLQSITNKFRTQTNYRHNDAMEALTQAVVSKALGELRNLFGQYCDQPVGPYTNCNPFPQGPPPPGRPLVKYIPDTPGKQNHRIFGKGDPAFQVELRQFDGSSFGPPRFVVPESDPEAWIDRFASTGIGNRVMPLRVTFTACRVDVGGRVPTGVAPYNLGVNWPTPCPPEHIVNVSYTGLIPRTNLVF